MKPQTPKKQSQLTKWSPDDFEKLIPESRPSERIHPEFTENFGESDSRPLSKVQFNVYSSHTELAWEFLRRNRFYQALVDRDEASLPESKWGYAWHPKIARTHGLVRLKPYWEAYQEGNPPAWIGLDGFAEQLPETASLKFETKSIELRPGQVAVIFDLAGIFDGQSPWQIQIEAAEERLRKLSKKKFKSAPLSGKSAHKNVLVRRLKLFDLLSEGRSITAAATTLGYGKRKIAPEAVATADAFSPQHLRSLIGTDQASEAVTTAFEDANEAYKLVYRHGYITLLQGERLYKLVRKSLTPYTIIRRSNKVEPLQDWSPKRKTPKEME